MTLIVIRNGGYVKQTEKNGTSLVEIIEIVPFYKYLGSFYPKTSLDKN